MLGSALVFLTSAAVLVTAENHYDEGLDDSYRNSSRSAFHAGGKGDMVVERFVETLMSSERYLKMIDTVERKLNHLDAAFHERTNSIIKYLGELLRVAKTTSPESLDQSLVSLKAELDNLKGMVSNKLPQTEKLRAYHAPSENADLISFDHRIAEIDGSLKNLMSGMDTILNTLAEVKSRTALRTPVKFEAGGTGQSQADVAANLINEFRRTLLEQRTKKCDCKMYGTVARTDRAERYPTDCHEIQLQGFNVSGIYKIKPEDMDAFYVLCDLSTAGGGWTVFQNRFDGSQDFYKNWWDYKHGFGNLAGEFWLGLDKLYYLTNQKLYELRIEMESHLGQEAYATYSVFTVGPESEGYRISTLGTYYGTGGDSLTYHAGQKFSTTDVDNDEWKDGSCSAEHGGAWWYKECDKSNLNGKHSVATDETSRTQAIYWISFKGPNVPLHKTKMMIRPLPASRPVDFETRKILERRLFSEKLKGLRKDTRGRLLYRYEAEPMSDPFYNRYT